MYRAVFEVPATVRIEVVVDADNQTDALTRAFDQVMAANPADATIEALHPEGARNIALERVSTAKTSVTVQAVQASQRDGYILHLYRGDTPEPGAQPDAVEVIGELAAAKARLQAVVGDDGTQFASGRLFNKLTGSVMATLRNKRGDWEVEAYDQAGSLVHSETWLSKADAMGTAKLLATRPNIKEVRVINFTDRQAGPQIHRRLT